MLHDKDKYNNEFKGVKPKNRVYCPDCGRQKMRFNSEKEAENFIKWNRMNFEEKIPSRIYWCEACCGYHITARPMGNVGVTINMKLPYLTEALENDRINVMRAVKTIYKVLGILRQPSGYYGKIGLGKCKSLLDNLNYCNNPYYIDERKQIYKTIEELRARYMDVWMNKKYCNLVKTKLYPVLCDMDDPYFMQKYVYNLAYLHYLAQKDNYSLENLPELFLDEWETLFKASPVSNCLTDKMKMSDTYGTDKDIEKQNNDEEGETVVPGVNGHNQSEGLQ